MKEVTKKAPGMKATSLRSALIILLITITAGASVGFYYTNNMLNELSIDIKKNSPTIASNDSIMNATEKLRSFISKNQAIADKSGSLTVSAGDSQTQIMNDLKKYANDTGITISNFNFNSTSMPSNNVGGSYVSKLATITIASPATYTNFIKFLSLVEANAPLMQPTGISITAVDNTKVKVEPLTIRFYTK